MGENATEIIRIKNNWSAANVRIIEEPGCIALTIVSKQLKSIVDIYFTPEDAIALISDMSTALREFYEDDEEEEED